MNNVIFYCLILSFFFISNVHPVQVEKIDVEKVETVDAANTEIQEQKDLQKKAQEEYKDALNKESIAEKSRDLLLKKAENKELTEVQRQNAREMAEKWSETMSSEYNRALQAKAAGDQADFNVKQLETRKNELAATTTIVHTKEQFLDNYSKTINKELSDLESQPISSIKKKEVLTAFVDIEYRNLTEPGKDYDVQRDQITILENEIRHIDLGKDDDRIRNLLESRVAEIGSFLQRKVKPLRGNSIDADLKLSEKIPSDQLLAVNEYLEKIIYELRAAIDAEDYESVQKANEKLDQLTDVINYYKKDYKENSEESKIIQQALDNVQGLAGWSKDVQKPTLIEVKDITQEDLQAKGVFPNLINEQGEFGEIPKEPEEKKSFFSAVREKVSKFVRYPVDQVKRGIVYVLETVGVNFASFGIRMKDLGATIKPIPQIAEATGKAIDNLANNWLVSGSIAAMRKSPILRQQMYAYSNLAEEGIEGAQNARSQAQEAGRVLNLIKSGEILSGIGNASIWIADKMGKAAGTDKIKNVFLVDSIERIIAREKKNIPAQEPLLSPKLKQEIKDTIAPVVNPIRTFLGWDKWNESIAEKTTKYERVKENFNLFMDNTIEPILNAAQELAAEYEQIAAGLNFSDESLRFIADDWKNFQFDQKAEIASVLEAFFDLRNKKLALLQEVRDGIANIKKSVQLNDYSANQFTQQKLSILDNLVSGESIKTIAEYNEVITAILNKLGEMKQKYLQPKK